MQNFTTKLFPSARHPARVVRVMLACALMAILFASSCAQGPENESDGAVATTADAVTASNASDFKHTPIAAGRTLWFSSVFDVKGLDEDALTHLVVSSSSITFTANNVAYDLPVPDGVVVFDPAATAATTVFDSAGHWVTTLPPDFKGNAFMTGLAYQVPVNLPGGIHPVSWHGTFTSDADGLEISWKWGAAVYSQFSTDYNALQVKPADDKKLTSGKDKAGTPEAFKTHLIAGGSGHGGSHCAGKLSKKVKVHPSLDKCLHLVVCPAPAVCHGPPVCQPATGTCTNPVLADGSSCPIINAAAECLAGVCSLVSCDAGFGNCNSSLNDGCETPTDTLSDCGACGNVCPGYPHGTPTCDGISCGLTCDPGFAGSQCQYAASPCTPNPCQNGGSCSPGAPPSSSYTCACAVGYTGANCEIDVLASNPCGANPCTAPGSTCVNDITTVEGYYCDCPASCPTGNNECEVGGCDHTNGVCAAVVPVSDGVPCSDDNNSCTADVCQAGQCAHVVGPDVCGNNCNATALTCNQQAGDCGSGFCSVSQDAVPGAFSAQTISLGDALLTVREGTAMVVGGNPVTTPVTITAQATSDPWEVPSGLPTSDPVLYPMYKFGPAGAQFTPALLFTAPVPLTATTPAAWLCDDAGLNCERRNGFLTLDQSVNPAQQTLTVAIDHFSTLVITQSPTAFAKPVCVSIQQGLNGGNVIDTTAMYDDTYHQPPPGGLWNGSQLFSLIDAPDAAREQYVPLLRWDISAIPAYANVTSALFYLHVENLLSKYVTSTVRPLSGPWDASTVTFNGRPGAYVPGVPLQYGAASAGADLTYMTQSWTIGAMPNHGIEIVADNVATPSFYLWGAAAFWSSEAPTLSVRPRLDVCYTVACPGPGCDLQSGPGPVAQVSAGEGFSCVVNTDGTLGCWGDNTYGQLNAPAGTFTQVSAGTWHGCAVATSGQVSCWGDDYFGQASPPSGTFTQVSSGAWYSCGVRTNGALACWGMAGASAYDYGQANPSAGNFTQVSVGLYHSCGLQTNQIPVCWGYDPPSYSLSYTQVANSSSSQATCVLFAGQLTCGGADAATPTSDGSLTQVSLGDGFGCAVRSTGYTRCWGDNSYGQASPPPDDIVQVSAGRQHACGVTLEGKVVCWGRGDSGETTVPASAVVAPSCSDGVQNGSESGPDCGGGTCAGCAGGITCSAHTDCASGNCSTGVCAANPCASAPCQNGGTCSLSASSYSCACPLGYTGTNCQDGGSPTSCAAIKAQFPGAGDGEYSILVAGQMVSVHCAGMSGYGPLEYLTLDKTGPGYNYSQYGPGQTTSYTRVLFDPATLSIALYDTTFTTNVGTNVQNIPKIPYATAKDCASPYSQTGTANVDLTGTPFAVVPNQFSVQGYLPAGSVAYSGGNKIVNLTGGGYCGTTSTANYGTTLLQLVFQADCPQGMSGPGCSVGDSCAAIKAANPASTDGDYPIVVAGEAVTLYCHDMATTPQEYLTLANTGGSYNFSKYAPNMTTTYTRVRFDPATLTVDVMDATFATTVGTNVQNQPFVPFGTASDCVGGFSATGTANVDLAGTPFALAPNQFITQGYLPAGSVSYSDVAGENKSVDLTGGGFCGTTTTANYATTPLQLVYQPDCPSGLSGPGCSVGDSCAAFKAANPASTDGNYSIRVAGQPVTLYCHNMAATPAEYLTLANTGGSYNFSTYAPNMTTTYTRVRVDPVTLLLDTTDGTFSNTVGTNVQNLPFVYYGSARDCISSFSATGTANIDLTGTPFAMTPGQFSLQGYNPGGSIMLDPQNKIANLTGGGFCGATGTANFGADPLQLVYQPD